MPFVPRQIRSLLGGLFQPKNRQNRYIRQQRFFGLEPLEDRALLAVALDVGLVAHWAFEEASGTTAVDSSGNNNHGTLVNGPSRTVGKIGGALNFDGNDDYVNVPNSTTLDQGLENNGFSVAAWVKYDAFYSDAQNDDAAIVEKDGDRFMLGLQGTGNNEPRFRLTTSISCVTMSGATLATGVWYHFVGIYDGMQMRLYRDGVAIANVFTAGTVSMSPADIHIGLRSAANANLDGVIDEVRLYNRALTLEEVQALYQQANSTPAVQIIDNGDAAYSTVGSWLYSTGRGHGGDIQYSAPGSGNDVAHWTFDVTPGRYRVSASWFASSNRASDAPYTILNGSNVLGTVRINQKQAANDVSDAGTTWEDLGGPYDITASTLAVALADAANGYVIAVAVRIERLADNVAPEIEVRVGSTNINDGGTVNFGSTSTDVAVDKQLTIRNVGSFDLTLTPLVPSSLPSGYSLVTNFGSTTLAPGASTTLTIRLKSATAGTYGGSISFGNNDADENPFNLSLQGTVVASPIKIIDNGDAGYSTVGNWLNSSGQGYGSDIQYTALGSGNDVARWTFGVTPGLYRVSASWFANANRASDAPYTILDGSNVLGTVRVNQKQAANDVSHAGTNWEDLGGPYDITGNTLVVALSDAANGYVIADAVRIEPVVVPLTQIIDNGDAGYTTVGNWLHSSDQGHGGDVQYSPLGSGNDVARWTFTVTPGRYRVSASWSTHANRASNAPYTIFNGSTVLATVAVNQRQAANDLSQAGTNWEHLGGPYDITGNTLVVALSDAANGYVIADAVRIERVG